MNVDCNCHKQYKSLQTLPSRKTGLGQTVTVPKGDIMNTQFTKAFEQLAGMRARYEDLRLNGAPFADRADALAQLHRQRAELAYIRQLIH